MFRTPMRVASGTPLDDRRVEFRTKARTCDVNYPANAGTRRRPGNYPLRDRVYWGDGIMLQNLSSNVRECLQRAKECEERAKLEPKLDGTNWHAATSSRSSYKR